MVFQELQTKLTLNKAGFSQGMREAIASLDQMNKKAVVAGGALAALSAGGIAKSVGAFAEFDKQMTESTAIMETTEEQQERMAETARRVGRQTQFSASEAAESYFFLASAGLDAETSMRSIGDAARFAQAGQFDMATATDIATDAQSALGLAVEDTEQNIQNMNRVMDVLVNANQQANASVEQFGDALTNRAAAAMRSANVELEEGTAILAAFADQGVKGKRAGQELSRILRLLSQSAAENTEQFEELGLVDAEGNLTDLDEIIAILTEDLEGMSDAQKSARLEQLGFTARTQQSIKPLLGMSDQVAEYEENLRDAGGAADDVAENQMQTASAQFGLLKSQLNDIAIGVGQNLTPVLVVLNNVIRGALERFQNFNRALGGVPATIILLAGLITGLVIVLGALSTFIAAAIVPGLATLAGAFTSAGAAALGAVPGTSAFAAAVNLAALPVTLIIGLILALVGVLGLLATNFGGFRDRWFNILQKWRAGTVDAIRALQNGFISLWETVVNSGVDARNSIAEIVNGMIQNVNRLLDAIPRVESELNEVGMAAEREFERVDRVAREELMEGGRFETREVGSGEDLTGLTDRFDDLFETPELNEGDIDEMGEQIGESAAEGLGDELPEEVQDALPEGTGEDIAGGVPDELPSGEGLPDDVGSDVSPEDVMPDAETAGGTPTGGTTRTPSADTESTRRTTTGDAGGPVQITLTNVPEIIDDNSLREFVRQIIKQVESQRLGDQRRQGAARR